MRAIIIYLKCFLFNLLSTPTRLADGLGLRDVPFYFAIEISPKFGSPASERTTELG